MRWKCDPYPIHNDERVRSWFAWFPVRIGVDKRWLETVHVKQTYSGYIRCWENNWFVADKQDDVI